MRGPWRAGLRLLKMDITEAVRIGEENILHVLNASAALAYDRRFDAFFYQVGGTTEMERLQLTPDEPQSAGIWGSVTPRGPPSRSTWWINSSSLRCARGRSQRR